MPKMPPTAHLFVTKEKKDKMLLLLMRGPMPVMPRHAPKPKRKEKKPVVEFCHAMRSRDVDPHKYACPDEKRRKKG